MRRLAFFLAVLLAAVAVHAGVTVISESKQPYEEIQASVDFSSRLMAGDNVHVQNCTAVGTDPWDNVVTSDIVALDNAVVTDNTFADNVFMDNTAKYTYKGGSDGNTYKITIRCVSDNGAKLEQDIIFKVQEF